MKAAKAIQEGKFSSQIVPIQVSKDLIFQIDENVRPDTALEKLAKLRPAFKEGGTITAGNAPSLNSGAAAMVLSTEEVANKFNLPVFGRYCPTLFPRWTQISSA